jgi:hypothetical protein
MLTYTELEKFYPNIKIFILFVFSMHNPKSEIFGCDMQCVTHLPPSEQRYAWWFIPWFRIRFHVEFWCVYLLYHDFSIYPIYKSEESM